MATLRQPKSRDEILVEQKYGSDPLAHASLHGVGNRSSRVQRSEGGSEWLTSDNVLKAAKFGLTAGFLLAGASMASAGANEIMADNAVQTGLGGAGHIVAGAVMVIGSAGYAIKKGMDKVFE
ncbi:MAG TPA: hypothetical protein ENN13_03450 [Candidatus Altiarchaeales archaeon]|nr:hypothetical protein [Candidatus Altiarchaeales archaeon]